MNIENGLLNQNEKTDIRRLSEGQDMSFVENQKGERGACEDTRACANM